MFAQAVVLVAMAGAFQVVDHRVVVGDARFTYLGDGIVRFEHAASGRFDDRPTFRALTMPAPQPFTSVVARGRDVVMRADGLEITYRPPLAGRGAPFGPGNPRVVWQAGGRSGRWAWGDVDRQNLGGLVPMDHVTRDVIPRGVHPAGPGHDVDRLDELNLMTTQIDVNRRIEADPSLHPAGSMDVAQIFQELARGVLPKTIRDMATVWLATPPGAVSRAGWTFLDETGMAFFDPASRWIDRAVRPDYQNAFLFVYGRDYRRAMRQLTALSGKIPLIPRWAFGAWYSCFQKYTADDNRRLVEEHARNRIPLDVLVVDMDWHENSWNGWDWNRKAYPDLPGFFGAMHKAGVHVSLNLHGDSISRADTHYRKICERMGYAVHGPDDPGADADPADPAHVAYLRSRDSFVLDHTDRKLADAIFDVCYRPNEALGVDFWWLDNWQGVQPGYDSVLWINHLVSRRMEESLGVRPLILGRYAGWGSHRYPAYFSGDTASHWEVLAHELDVNARAGQVGMTYLSHDLGGFKGPVPGESVPLVDTELYVRWMQMGALSPVMRVHSDHGTREPWKYGERALVIVRQAYDLHTRLVPYLYHLGRQAYDDGTPIHLPLYYLHPDDERAYQARGEYFVGERLLAAPVATPGGRRSVYLPAGVYLALPDGERLVGPTTIDRNFALDRIPLFVRAGSLIPEAPVAARVGSAPPDPLVLAVYPGGDDRLDLYEDDGTTVGYQRGESSRWPITLHDDGKTPLALDIGAAVGRWKGMPERRRVTVRVHFVDRPTTVELDGQAVSEGAGGAASRWAYDAKARELSVTVPPLAVAMPHRLTVAAGR